MPRLKVKQTEPPQPVEVMAEAIVKIGDAMRKIDRSRLNQEAIVVLLQHKTKVSQKQIKLVLNGLRQLEGWYLKRKSQ
jgi:hypothetical protein